MPLYGRQDYVLKRDESMTCRKKSEIRKVNTKLISTGFIIKIKVSS